MLVENAPDSHGLVLKDADFEVLRRLASEHSGIMLPASKRTMVRGRLSKRMRALGIRSFSDYRALLESGSKEEFGEFINCLTTNLTYFFREPHHFEHLAEQALPECMHARTAKGQNRLRLWSAASSTGEEPYSIMMTVLDALSDKSGWDVRLLATDLDTRVLAAARAGVYGEDSVQGLDPALLGRWFLRGSGSLAGRVRTKPSLQRNLEFRQLNLVQPWTMPEPFDIIFCRNVIIYFDKEVQKKLFARMAAVLVPGGYLYLGHSELLLGISDRFTLVGKSVYRKNSGSH